MLPYFKKSEGQQEHRNEWHGTDGPLTVERHRYVNRLTEVFLEAATAEGYPANGDFNGPVQEGFGYYQVTQRGGRRCSTATAFLHPIRHRSNLTVLTAALAHRILIEAGRAVGVEYTHKGRMHAVRAGAEVLLSAGAFNSPQLLLLSGIGDPAVLQPHGIPLAHSLPGVGRNLQEHLIYFAMFNSSYSGSLDGAERFPAVLGHLWTYFLHQKGPFSSNVANAGGFFKSFETDTLPDQQIHFGPCYFNNHGFDNPKTGYGYSIGSVLLAPKSRVPSPCPVGRPPICPS